MITLEQASKIVSMFKSDNESDQLLARELVLDLWQKGELTEKFFVWCVGYISINTVIYGNVTSADYWDEHVDKHFPMGSFRDGGLYLTYDPLKDGL